MHPFSWQPGKDRVGGLVVNHQEVAHSAMFPTDTFVRRSGYPLAIDQAEDRAVHTSFAATPTTDTDHLVVLKPVGVMIIGGMYGDKAAASPNESIEVRLGGF